MSACPRRSCSRATAAHVKIPVASLARRKLQGKKFMISGDLECSERTFDNPNAELYGLRKPTTIYPITNVKRIR
jgi:hypothetical protein